MNECQTFCISWCQDSTGASAFNKFLVFLGRSCHQFSYLVCSTHVVPSSRYTQGKAAKFKGLENGTIGSGGAHVTGELVVLLLAYLKAVFFMLAITTFLNIRSVAFKWNVKSMRTGAMFSTSFEGLQLCRLST